MKKIFGIVLALVLGLSLVTATSVVADVGSAIVTVAPDTVGSNASYKIVFNITSTLAIGATISIEFPTGTTVPTTYATGNVTVQNVSISSGDISVSTRTVTITLPTAIGAPSEVTVVFNVTAGIKNPATPSSDYTVRVKTSKEPNLVTSAKYTIRLADKSTYKFVFAVPEKIWVDQQAGINVTLQTNVLGQYGYDSTLIAFNTTVRPAASDVTFQVYEAPNWLPAPPFTNSGQCPVTANLSVGANYSNTFPFRLTFNKVGVYTIKFVLDNLGNGDIVTDEITVMVTGTSFDVKLNKGWNLISLPIIPDIKTPAAVLAGILDKVVSVHHYTTTGTWQIYAPGYSGNSLTTMEDGRAYWINMLAAANLTVVGQAIAPPGSGSPPPTYPVVKGWNMVGFRSMANMVAGDYLKETKYVRIYGFDLGQNGWFPLTSSQNMTPGLGYWVAFSEAGTIYP